MSDFLERVRDALVFILKIPYWLLFPVWVTIMVVSVWPVLLVIKIFENESDFGPPVLAALLLEGLYIFTVVFWLIPRLQGIYGA